MILPWESAHSHQKTVNQTQKQDFNFLINQKTAESFILKNNKMKQHDGSKFRRTVGNSVPTALCYHLQIGHTQRFKDDRYKADMMVRRVTNLKVVAQGYGDAIADGAPDFATVVLFHLVIFLE